MTPPFSPEAIGRYYDTLLARHGDTAQGAGWPNEPDRQRRFAVMRDLAWHGAPLGRLCDLACGTGAFLRWLQSQGEAPASYTGIDLSPAAVALARETHPGADFRVADILKEIPADRFDHVVANGLFTVKAELSQDAMWEFMTRTVRAMWNMAEKGIAFNVMSSIVDWRRDDLFHVESDRLLAFLHGLAGRRVVLRADYDLWEYTVYVYRDPLSDRDVAAGGGPGRDDLGSGRE